jgi:hypothetical protein
MYVVNTQHRLNAKKVRGLQKSKTLPAVLDILGVKHGGLLPISTSLPRLQVGKNVMYDIMTSSTRLYRLKGK